MSQVKIMKNITAAVIGPQSSSRRHGSGHRPVARVPAFSGGDLDLLELGRRLAHTLWLFVPDVREAGLAHCFRSFGFEFQGRCSAFTSWRARKRDPKTFSLAAHNTDLILGHVTFVLQQLFQISLERGLCF